MILTDCHLHTSFSSDSDVAMEEMIKSAINRGFKTITFTEHMDLEFPASYDMPFVFDTDAYDLLIKELSFKYKAYITVLKGIEIGLKPNLAVDYDNLLNAHHYDFVIGSTHLVDNIDPYYPEYWEGAEEKAQIIKYFRLVNENIKSITNFDSLGHLDYILRYAPSKENAAVYHDYSDIVDIILKHIIYNGIALEVNSSGYKSGLNAPNPKPDVIKRFLELGGNRITIGSDAHTTEYIGYSFDKVYNLLKGLGVKYYCVFKDRKPEFIPL